MYVCKIVVSDKSTMEDLVDLLGENPCLAPDIYFRVVEEQIVDGNIKTKVEVVGAHKFVLAMVSDVFKALFFGPTWENDVRLSSVNIMNFN